MEGPIGRGGSGTDMFLPNYKIGRTLGIGSFGKVKIAEHAMTGHKVAIKILNRRKIKSMDMEEKVRREIKILRLFMHPHIIRLYEVIETPSDIYVVMEYVKTGELFDYIVEKGRLQEDEARGFFQQIISGVEYCHRNMVVHRDLKPENLLLDSKRNVKIADFGLSNIMRDGHFLKTSCGSPNYAAPEVISGKLYAGPEGGIYTLPSHLSPGARDLIPRMLVVDPMKRMTIPEIRQHPWFQARLPRYLAVPPPDTMQQAKKEESTPRVKAAYGLLPSALGMVNVMGLIDEEILQEVIKMGFDRNQLIDSLRNRVQDEATVAYYLLLDNRFRASSGYLGAEFQETMECSFPRMHPCEPVTSPMGHHMAGYMDHQGYPLRSNSSAEKKWALGIQVILLNALYSVFYQSRAHPREIMMEVLRALQEMNVAWKKIGHYNMKCRWFPGHPDNGNSTSHGDHIFADECSISENECAKSANVIKFELQLYKTRDEKYLLDLQRVQGPQLLFLDLCAAFLTQLRVL
ncbi:SNF1-related protein kinase catalytic subunit alpha KIN10 [Acorus calamus]|uniref:non-specific serine/threonine protein kinase n=1 Tax=Acorus calamus TaxID=4465 RepID=A0AAV9CCR3_ACOCL|nr:SNF1-related protein kinase catalytic subunit alpha KIN10 [Acorus calamus]